MTREQTPIAHPDSQLLAELEELLSSRRYESVSWLVAESWLSRDAADGSGLEPAGPATNA